MTLAHSMLLAFALWTLLVPLGAVAGYRFSRVLFGGASANDFPADVPHGPAWYRRALRVHANAVENLPIFATLVLLASLVLGPNQRVDLLACIVFAGRVGHGLVHLAFAQTARVVALRFVFFVIQVAAMLGIAAELLAH